MNQIWVFSVLLVNLSSGRLHLAITVVQIPTRQTHYHHCNFSHPTSEVNLFSRQTNVLIHAAIFPSPGSSKSFRPHLQLQLFSASLIQIEPFADCTSASVLMCQTPVLANQNELMAKLPTARALRRLHRKETSCLFMKPVSFTSSVQMHNLFLQPPLLYAEFTLYTQDFEAGGSKQTSGGIFLRTIAFMGRRTQEKVTNSHQMDVDSSEIHSLKPKPDVFKRG